MSVAIITENLVFGEVLSNICSEKEINVIGVFESVSSIKWLHSGDLLLAHLRVDDRSLPGDLSRLKTRFSDLRIVFLVSSRLSTEMRSAIEPFASIMINESDPANALISALTLAELGYHLSSVPGEADSPEGTPARNPPVETGTNSPKLSRREITILDCLRQGLTNKRIAIKLGITETTVKVHLRSVYRKIGVSNRTQAALWASSEHSGGTAEYT